MNVSFWSFWIIAETLLHCQPVRTRLDQTNILIHRLSLKLIHPITTFAFYLNLTVNQDPPLPPHKGRKGGFSVGSVSRRRQDLLLAEG